MIISRSKQLIPKLEHALKLKCMQVHVYATTRIILINL